MCKKQSSRQSGKQHCISSMSGNLDGMSGNLEGNSGGNLEVLGLLCARGNLEGNLEGNVEGN